MTEQPPTLLQDPEAHRTIPPADRLPSFFETDRGRKTALWLIGCLSAVTLLYGFFYFRLARMVDARLSSGAFSDTVNIFTAPRVVRTGDSLTQEQVVAGLRRSGYSVARGNTLGWYHIREHAVEIFPGRASYAGGEPGVLEFSGGHVSRIVSLEDNTLRQSFLLEPQLVANLSEQRERRRLVRFQDIPASLVHAVVSVEDKRFFNHSGFDVSRILKAAYIDMKDGRKEQGASTLTMQLARGLWLDPDKRWDRKVKEFLITLHLEERLSKEQIFEYYANQVYLGRRGTFSINGFGEAARAYFGKDLSQLSNAESALLAGLVQRPSYYNPYRYPERVQERRDVVLALMRQNNYLADEEYRRAVDTPVKIVAEQSETVDSPYFVDLMNQELQSKLEDRGRETRYIYTTLDPQLQAAAQAAVRAGMALVDQELGKNRKKSNIPHDQPQVALIALDPHTGEVKALVGGRDYETSQLNHALAMRQPGSVFKPFVYAAALESAIQGGAEIFTPASIVSDTPTTFTFDRRAYQPANFHHQFMGDVTLRTALAHSLNVATVKVAQSIGFDRVVSMAQRAGLNHNIKATPAVALGAYETTPIEIAGAYTAFANQGMRVVPTTISLIRAPDGTVVYQHRAEQSNLLDPRVNYLMVSMLQDVLRYGTGAGIRSRGFNLPAAGKTGTSRDGWFAGFTNDLLCVVWVGFDDNRELNLEGAHSALPIWAEFMKRAAELPEYRSAKPFAQPSGVVSASICADSGQLAGEYCPNVRTDVFIDGTQPVAKCSLHSLDSQVSADRIVELGTDGPPSSVAESRQLPQPSSAATNSSSVAPRPIMPRPESAATGARTAPPVTAPRTVPSATNPQTVHERVVPPTPAPAPRVVRPVTPPAVPPPPPIKQ